MMTQGDGSPLQLFLYCLFGVIFVMGLLYLVPLILNAIFNRKQKKEENNSEDQSDSKG